MSRSTAAVSAAAIAMAALIGADATVAQTAPTPVPAVTATVAPSPATHTRIAEGTELRLHLGDRLSSATSTVGDTFVVILDESVRLSDGTVIPAGYSGRGEVTVAEKNGMLGKSGQLGLRVDYLKIGDTHVHLRANKAGEGASGVTNTVVVTVLLGPLGLLVHGHSIVYPKGTPITAYVDQDTDVSLPLAAPPTLD
jgi:hypothetical protein